MKFTNGSACGTFAAENLVDMLSTKPYGLSCFCTFDLSTNSKQAYITYLVRLQVCLKEAAGTAQKQTQSTENVGV